MQGGETLTSGLQRPSPKSRSGPDFPHNIAILSLRTTIARVRSESQFLWEIAVISNGDECATVTAVLASRNFWVQAAVGRDERQAKRQFAHMSLARR